MAHSLKVGEAHEIDICRRRGATQSFRIRLLKPGTTDPLDVTGYSAQLNIHSIKDPIDVTTLVFLASGTVSGTPTDGYISFDFSLFDPVPIGNYYYGTRLIDSGGLDSVPMLGKFIVEQDRTWE